MIYFVSALGRTFLVGVSALAFTHVAVAQARPDSKTVLQKVTAAYGALKQYEFTLKTTLEQVTTSGEKQTDIKTYKLAVERQDRIRMELENADMLFGEPVNAGRTAGPMLLVGDRKGVWVYAPALKRYGRLTSKISAEAAALVSNPSNWITRIEQTLLASVQSALTQTDDAKPIGQEQISLDGKSIDCYVIEANSGVSKVWVDKRNYLVVREVDLGAGVLTIMDFLVGRINVPFPDDFFLLKPGPDAKEEDLDLTRNPFQ
jgi:outer membrane lipoprotein-sorting protein